MEALRDQNHRTVGMGVSSSDGITPVMLKVDPATGYLLVHMNAIGLPSTVATENKRDGNYVPTCYGISSVDGETLVPIRTDDLGNLLTVFE